MKNSNTAYIFRHEIQKSLKTKREWLSFFLIPLVFAIFVTLINTLVPTIINAQEYTVYVLGEAWEAEEQMLSMEQKVKILPVPETDVESLIRRIDLKASDVIVDPSGEHPAIWSYSPDSMSQSLAGFALQRLEAAEFAALTDGTETLLSMRDLCGAEQSENQNTDAFPFILLTILSTEILSRTFGTISGDREDGVLDTLVLTGTDYQDILIGKTLAGVLLGICSGLIYVGFSSLFSLLTENMGMTVSLRTLEDYLNLAIVVFLVLGTAAGLGLMGVLCSFLTNDRKGAESLSAIPNLFVMLLAFIPLIEAGYTSTLQSIVPVYGVCHVLNDFFKGAASLTTGLSALISVAVILAALLMLNVVLFRKQYTAE